VDYELTNPDSIEAWAEMIKPFFPNSFGLACTAFQNQLPYGIPTWIIESTVASFFSQFAMTETSTLWEHLQEEAKKDPFRLDTIDEYNGEVMKFGEAGRLQVPIILELNRNN